MIIKIPKINLLSKVIIVDECSLMNTKHIELLTNISKHRPVIFSWRRYANSTC
jgi:thymidine kinase